jgi:hypothetical protein
MGDAQQPRQRRWLKWMGLQEPPIDPDAWMAVAKDLGVDDAATGLCVEAKRLADALTAAGIEAHQRSYAAPDQGATSNFRFGTLVGGDVAASRVRVAVVVHQRDLDRANALVAGLPRVAEQVRQPPTPQSAGLPPMDVTNGGPADN